MATGMDRLLKTAFGIDPAELQRGIETMFGGLRDALLQIGAELRTVKQQNENIIARLDAMDTHVSENRNAIEGSADHE